MQLWNRHTLVIVLLWVILTILGEVAAFSWDYFPVAAAEEAHIVDDAFRILVIFAVPLFAFVVAMLVYAALRFRSKGRPSEDGPPIHSHRVVVAAWFAVTTALTILIIVHPGLTGMSELHSLDHEAVDLVVEAEAMRFAWRITYPQQNVTSFNKELVLPVGKHVRFDVTSRDVLHSFWIPAFRVKIDAVPGLVTTEYATPDKTGDFARVPIFRLQCAELCGLGHAKMTIPVRVVEQSEFDTWVAENTETARRTADGRASSP